MRSEAQSGNVAALTARSDCSAALASAATQAVLSCSRLPLPQMIRQRQRHAVAQRFLGQLLAGVEQNAAVAAIAQFRIELAEGLDQIGLAVEIHRVPAGFRLHLVDPDRAAALALGREIARLPPFQRLFQRADALGGVSRVEDQPAQRQQSGFHRLRIGLEDGFDRGTRAAHGLLCDALLHRIVGGVSRLPDRIALPASS